MRITPERKRDIKAVLSKVGLHSENRWNDGVVDRAYKEIKHILSSSYKPIVKDSDTGKI